MSAEPNGSPAREQKPDGQQAPEINSEKQPAPERKPEEDQAPKHINIKVKDMNEGETFFKIKPTTKLSKVMEAFCQRHAMDRTGVRFLFEGSRIQDGDTPESLEMDDGDMIEAMIEQTGGGGGDDDGEEEEEPQRMTLKVRNADGNEMDFAVKPTTKLSKLMKAYSKSQEKDESHLRFLFDGERVQNEDTPQSRGMENGDVIQVFLEQQGGDGTPGPSASDADDAPKSPKPDAEHVLLRVKDQHGAEVNFKIKKTAALRKLKDAFCNNQGRAPGSLRFFTPDGARVNDDSTPESLLLEDGDILDAHEEQQGGSDWI